MLQLVEVECRNCNSYIVTFGVVRKALLTSYNAAKSVFVIDADDSVNSAQFNLNYSTKT